MRRTEWLSDDAGASTEAVDPLHWPWRTTAAETVLDIAGSSDADELFALLGRAFQRRLTSEDEIRAALAVRRAYRWRHLLAVVLADVAEGAESAMEVRYVNDVERAHGLTGWHPPDGVTQRHEPAA